MAGRRQSHGGRGSQQRQRQRFSEGRGQASSGALGCSDLQGGQTPEGQVWVLMELGLILIKGGDRERELHGAPARGEVCESGTLPGLRMRGTLSYRGPRAAPLRPFSFNLCPETPEQALPRRTRQGEGWQARSPGGLWALPSRLWSNGPRGDLS